ncbi:MAG: hypothetical protein ABL897_05805 [Hyphomicrobium sp.]
MPEFIGVDGEGVTLENGEHRYVLLTVGERALHRGGEQLHCDEIFAFLWECFEENPDKVFVGFSLKYDFAQWFRTMPQDRAESLYNANTRRRKASGGNTTPFPVYYRDEWEFDILADKRFKLRKAGAKHWLYICDVFGFFQQSFATAMLDWQDRDGNRVDVVQDDERDLIERGKAKRATAVFDKEMMRYNAAENRVLARMMRIMAEGLKELGISMRRHQWYGPGQIAQKWLDQNAPAHQSKVIRAMVAKDDIFRSAADAARSAYYGGWFETMAHGHCGDAFEYDISSAYPHIISGLPCLLHGKWEHIEGRDAGAVADPWTLVRADVRGDNPHIGAMLHRDKQGRINRPLYTSGWFWKTELDAAARAGLVCEVQAHEAYVYHACSCPPPVRDLRASFLERLKVGKKTPLGRSIKLKDNSVYGKMAQSVGLPKYANPFYAGLTTSGTRTMICDAIASHPKGASDVLMIATDGIYFRSQHPTLSEQEIALGNWEETRKRNLSIFLPGIYWDDASRERRGDTALKLKSRGVSARDLIQRLDDLDGKFDAMLGDIPWRMFEGDVSDDWWAKLSLPIGFSMVSPKQALQRGDWSLAGRVTQGGEREIWAHPRVKRELVIQSSAEYPYVRSTPPHNYALTSSVPYSKDFGLMWEQDYGDEIVTPEGDMLSDAMALIRG